MKEACKDENCKLNHCLSCGGHTANRVFCGACKTKKYLSFGLMFIGFIMFAGTIEAGGGVWTAILGLIACFLGFRFYPKHME